MSVQSPADSEKHFAFGANWASYARLVGEPEIEQAEQGLLKLIPAAELNGRSFLDIGCGSGLHALAAARLGVSRIVAIDYDPDSASTARALLERFAVVVPWRAERADLFELDPAQLGVFDVVYSWGVLHHTGDMWRAVERAASFVAPGGLLAIALYRSTRMDAFWIREKRWYANASAGMQRLARAIYRTAHRADCLVSGRSYRDMVKNYRSSRGMDFHHDVHDWLGGHPYETALAPEVDAKLTALGFKAERVFARPMTRGLLGSGCDEYVYRRISA